MKNTRFQIISLLILLGAFTRLIPHPANFTALAAIGLFGGYYLKNMTQTILVISVALLLSDAFIGFHILMPVIYLALLIPIAMGQKAQGSSALPWIMGGAVLSSISFFIITNFAVWAMTAMYPRTFAGLLMCYEAAIPFFQNQLIGDLFYSALIFGVFMVCQMSFPALRNKSFFTNL